MFSFFRRKEPKNFLNDVQLNCSLALVVSGPTFSTCKTETMGFSVGA
jgi:hypothetical protein